MKYWICVTLNFAFTETETIEKGCIHYLLFIQLSDSWFMIRLDLNISCPHLDCSNAWSADTWLILNDVEIMFCHVYLPIDVLMSLCRCHKLESAWRYNYFNGCIQTSSSYTNDKSCQSERKLSNVHLIIYLTFL